MDKFKADRRTLLKGGTIASLAASVGMTDLVPNAFAAQTHATLHPRAPQGLDGSGTKLVLLGTGGGPILGQRRHMTSHLLISNGATYVVDCGMTVSNRIAQARGDFKSIKGVFITHHHPDHNAEYGPLLLMAWIQGRYGSLETYGPPPLRQITDDYLKSIKWTTDLWVEDMKVPPFPAINVHEVAVGGPVMSDENVRVTATLVQHPPIVPALGYRFDFQNRSIAFSGDTVMAESVVELARGADVLVHEAMYVPALDRMIDVLAGGKAPAQRHATIMDHMLRDHTTAEQAGIVAERAGVKTLVLSHLTPGADRPVVPPATWINEAKKHFSGEVILGDDLMVI
ncbi:MBL fold metallo-hydrolase [Stakelama tenebrarum]|uniref:MBL fold metallo-hydrolase n=1 Tax=Stakelama tenebrarum TaxID=2711215 RepID=A0A6G6Y1Y8_9SPHN|nr:MBL fold metallo-hydrolase [Sphingosinithalassobacter tenebrarum]QIG78623.1 MBL fold metallo-hydrolase [Sphingosinithalassobacter tenebrarum]